MRFLLCVEVADVTDEFAIVWERDTERHGSYLTRLTDRGREVFVARPELTRYIGASPLCVWAHEAWRIAAPPAATERRHR
jgi:tRNA-modifying protein YgfZ